MTTLFMDTTWSTLMLALGNETGLIAEVRERHAPHRYHSAVLLPEIQQLLEQHCLLPKDITQVAVNLGPGSFTGIRSGLTIARLMGQFTGTQTYGFNTFTLIAGHPEYRNHAVTVLMNAFRQQHYRVALCVGTAGDIEWLEKPKVCPNEAIQPVESDYCLIDASLQDKLPVLPKAHDIIDETSLFTPTVMAFLLQQHPQHYRYAWQDLKPEYMQLPNITQPKAQSASTLNT